MQEQRDESNKQWRRGILLGVAVCVAAVCGFVVGTRERRDAPDSIPIGLLKMSTPIFLQIDVTLDPPEKTSVWMEGERLLEAKGTARYTFTNWRSSRVKVAFPPARTFGYDASTVEHQEATPAFASDTLTLDLAPGESKSFSESVSLSGGTEHFNRYLRGGPGTLAFVFDAPRPELRKEYCVGTVFGCYTASIRKPSENDRYRPFAR